MAKYTARDRIWNLALKMDDEFTPAKLADCLGHGERTVRDCLNCMWECGYLERSGGEGREPVTFRSRISNGNAETPVWGE